MPGLCPHCFKSVCHWSWGWTGAADGATGGAGGGAGGGGRIRCALKTKLGAVWLRLDSVDWRTGAHSGSGFDSPVLMAEAFEGLAGGVETDKAPVVAAVTSDGDIESIELYYKVLVCRVPALPASLLPRACLKVGHPAQFDDAFGEGALVLGPGLTLVGEGGLLVGSGSTREAAGPGGRRLAYAWQDGHSIADLPPPLPPRWLVDAARGAMQKLLPAAAVPNASGANGLFSLRRQSSA